jgi:preprotein translocase subunit SecA
MLGKQAALRALVARTAALEDTARGFSDKELRERTNLFRRRLATGETHDAILPEAFALVREAARRTVELRHYDVQVLAGIILHRGAVAELKTGEGKTLVATLPAYLNAITGQGVHIVTANDYLARRDCEWMAPVYRALGLTVGFVIGDTEDDDRHRAYRCDITYTTGKDVGFDYLRDELKRLSIRRRTGADVLGRWHLEAGHAADVRTVQRGHHYALVDEADSILIDEARVPLIIASGMKQASPYADAYRTADRMARGLQVDEHYTVKYDERAVELTDAGREAVETAAPDACTRPPGRGWPHLVEQALIARRVYRRDQEYIIKDDEIVIVDEFTGRQMADRNWQLGLHQAIQAAEGVQVTTENRTEASITFQRYFNLYTKLAGMTGTAKTSAAEFRRVYKRDVICVPTHRPLRRTRYPEQVAVNRVQKERMIAERIRDMHAGGRPVLVGTRSVEKSERISRLLETMGVRHNVLNAKEHDREAKIVAGAGQRGQVTIATNMAGRGTDIVLGPGVAEVGGLHVIGTEFHEAQRIDNQLIGRAGRQGDPGSSEFFLALDDDLLSRQSRRFSAWLMRRARKRSGRLGRWLPRLFRLAQRRLERKHLRARVSLGEHDKWLEDLRKTLGLPQWG